MVNEPPQQRVKLTMGGKSPEPPPKITLKFGSSKSNSQAGVSVDNESLKRQQDLVKAGINGQGQAMSTTSFDRQESGSDSGAINGVKHEASHGHSPAFSASQMTNGVTNPTMPPPTHLNPGVQSGSPHPQTAGVNGVAPSSHHSSTTNTSHLRQAGRGKQHDGEQSELLIHSKMLLTH